MEIVLSPTAGNIYSYCCTVTIYNVFPCVRHSTFTFVQNPSVSRATILFTEQCWSQVHDIACFEFILYCAPASMCLVNVRFIIITRCAWAHGRVKRLITRCAWAHGRVKRLSPSICVWVCVCVCGSAKTRLFAVLLLENRHEIALYRSASQFIFFERCLQSRTSLLSSAMAMVSNSCTAGPAGV